MTRELSVRYLGLELSSPVIVGACPLTTEPETVRQLAGAGAGAIVLPSMLQEQVVHRMMKSTDPLGAVERSGYQPQQDQYNTGADNYLSLISSLKRSCPIPIFASMNGASAGEWIDYAKEIESAGADALEFNLQPAIFDDKQSSDQIESGLCDMIRQTAQSVTIPLSVKISQRYTNLAAMARQLHDAGAAGIVLFTHLPHWDVCTDRMHWTIRWELSPPDSIGGVLEGIVRVKRGNVDMSIAASGGIASSENAVKAMIAGADVVMITSAVYREGPDAIRKIVDGLERHVELSRYESLGELQQARPDVQMGPEHLVRLEYVDPLTSTDTYYDPTPMASQQTGDAFGHKR